MLGEILLKMVSALTPDDIKQIKAAGCGDEVRAILGGLDKLAVSVARWRIRGDVSG